MNFVESLSMFHVDAKEIPCVTEKGAPTEKTLGAPGVLYMDTDTGDLYKCRAADAVNKVYNWEKIGGGSSDYKLPIGGEQLGGVKNGGNVVINEDGTMTAPGSGSSQNVELDTTLTQSGKAADAAATGARLTALEQLGGITIIEPAEDDIPKVFLTGDAFGDMTTAKNEVVMALEYISKTMRFPAGIKIKFQGNSSLSYPKKNFTVKLYEDETCQSKLKKNFRGWGAQNKFVLKANYIDHSHARNIMSARLWDQIVSSRIDYNDLPEELKASPCNGAVDGFPVKLYVNGAYQGLYTWNIPKDAWMFAMDEDNANHAVLCAEYNNSANPGTVSAYPACEFRKTWGGNSDGTWSVEVPDEANDSIVASFNALISCIKDTDDATFKETIDDHLDLQSAIDYYLFAYLGCFFDNLGKNMLMATYDGTKWFCSMYDMDNVWGLRFTKNVLPQPYDTQCPEGYGESYSLLWQRIEKLYYRELQERYEELRKTVLSETNIINTLERFTDSISSDLLAEDIVVYPGILFPNENHVRQIRTFVVNRATYVDAEIAALDGTSFCDRDGDGVDDYVVNIPCTGITLSAVELTFTGAGTQTLTATVTPEETTDHVIWVSDNHAVATVNGGIVTAVGNGECTITARCGEYSASCGVSASGFDVGTGALYPLKNGEKNGTRITANVSGGNHVEISVAPSSVAANSSMTNITDVESNSNGMSLEDETIRNTEWFALKTGQTITVSAKNVSTPGPHNEVKLALRKKGTKDKVVDLIDLGPDKDAEASATMDADTSVSHALVYITMPPGTEEVNVSFDLSIYVDGVQYV